MKKISVIVTIIMLVLALSACGNQIVKKPADNLEITLKTILNASNIEEAATIEINYRSVETNDIAVLTGEQAATFINELFSLPLMEIKKAEFTRAVFNDVKYTVTTGDGKSFEIVDVGAFTTDNGQRYFAIKAGERPDPPESTVWNTYSINDMTAELTLECTSTQFARNKLKEYFYTLSPEEVDVLRKDHQMISMMLMDSYWK